jgi:hypothetical protein
MSCETTVLTGTSGAFYYKPAGTEVCLLATDFPATGSNIQAGSYQGFRVGDLLTLAYPAGATVTNAIAAGDYYVKTYAADTGIMTISTTPGGTAATATAQPSGFGGEKASLKYKNFAVLGQVRDWTFEITRNEIDVTTIGQGTGQYAPFRKFVTGFADGTGTATIYTTEDDTSLANRMIEDVIQRKQLGAEVKLYIDQVLTGGVVSDTLSRYIQSDIVLTSASLGVNPDDAQSVSINFRPSGAPVFDLVKTA